MADLEVHLLDVGAIEYGDSVLCRIDGKTILIDGGKKKSSTETFGRVHETDITHKPIQEQIENLIGGTELDLLVISHCHADHVGNLPDLITNGDLSCKHALLADPQFGFGITGDTAEPPPAADMTPAEKLWMALREEPVHSTDDRVIREFIEDSANEYTEYIGLVNKLKQDLGNKCVLYRGLGADSTNLQSLLTTFASTGLKILGPTKLQLGNCALFLAGRDQDFADLQDFIDRAGRVDLVAAYREALRIQTTGDEEDSSENGNAVNNQSMVITVGTGAQRALLTADMQFVKPQVANDHVKQEMKNLLAAIDADVAANGPFGFVKLSHHGATNGQNLARLQSWGAKLLAISTGSKSTKHPPKTAIDDLKALIAADSSVKFYRTDVNGRVKYKATAQGRSMTAQRFSKNDDTLPVERSGDAAGEEETLTTGRSTATDPRVSVERTSSAGVADGTVEVHVRVPNGRTRVTVTVDIDPGAGGGDNRPL